MASSAQAKRSDPRSNQREDLSKAISHLLEECRMVLPGIQALFGFQWVAFFNHRFTELPDTNQKIHLIAIALVALAAALLMTPAAYHREVEPDGISEKFLHTATQLLLCGMLLLAIAIPLDFYVVSSLVLQSKTICILISALMWLTLLGLWFAFPMIKAKRQPNRDS
jgi:hypothetical protein